MRTVRAIQEEIAATAARLAELTIERDAAHEARRLGIIADFDAGMVRKRIAGKWDVDYGYVANILHSAVPRRTEKLRKSMGLSGPRRQHYEVALRGGASATLARSIAQAVSA